MITTAMTTGCDAEAAVAELAASLGPEAPDFLALHFGAGVDAAALRDAVLARYPGTAVHGGSSCLGAMTGRGAAVDGSGIAAFAIRDPAGDFGTASADLGLAPREAAARATEAALAAAGRPGEAPALVWLTLAPGREEAVLAGIKDIVGPSTMIVGGSSADNDVTGNWCQFSPDGMHHDGVVVSVLFPSCDIASSFRSGYAPAGRSAVVTGVEGRRLISLDHAPAARVYSDWTGIAVPAPEEPPAFILAPASWYPLGRATGQIAGVPFYLLTHPASAEPDGSMAVFADLQPGDRVTLMQGTADSLVGRAGRVAEEACAALGGPVSGALVVYCGGCMLAVQDRVEEVARGIDAALGGAPFMGVFTFGEQGVPDGGEALHGNLMISCTVFGG